MNVLAASRIRVLVATLLLGIASPTLALDSGRVRDIEQADTAEELVEVAEDLVEDMADIQAAEPEQATRVAAETAAYLLYIQVKQQNLVLRALQSKP